jgi:hypothetical protein
MMEELHTNSINGAHEASYGARSGARERAYSNKYLWRYSLSKSILFMKAQSLQRHLPFTLGTLLFNSSSCTTCTFSHMLRTGGFISDSIAFPQLQHISLPAALLQPRRQSRVESPPDAAAAAALLAPPPLPWLSPRRPRMYSYLPEVMSRFADVT